MSAQIIDGKALVKSLRPKFRERVAALATAGIEPGLAVILVGDVDFAGVRQKAAWITPVPSGVGPMAVSMLIENTLRSAERAMTAPSAGTAGWVQPQPVLA